MLTRITRWLEPPNFDGDEEQTNQARIANTLILSLGAALLVVIFVLIPLLAIQKIGSWIISIAVFGALAIGRHLIFKGRLQLGSLLVFSVIYLCVLAMLVLSGGSSSTAMFYFATVVLIAGYFLEAHIVNWLTIPTFLIAIGITFLQDLGLVALPQVFVFNSVFSWLATGLGILFMIRARDLFVGDLKTAVASAQQKNLALQESEKKYHELFRVNKDGIAIFLLDPRGIPSTFVELNNAAPQMLGYTREEMLKLAPPELEPQTTPAELAWRQAQIEAEGVANFETSLRHKNGQPVFAEITAQLIQYENRPAIMNLVRDITARKQAEEALRQSEAKFRAVVENSNDGILFGDAKATIHYRSPSYYRINGYTDGERVGHSGFETVHPDDTDGLQRWWAQLVQAPGFSARTEYRIRHKDGTWRWIETTGQNLLGNPDVRSVVVASRNVTERKQAEIEMARKNKQLTTLNQLGQALNKLAPLPETLEQISDLIGQVLDNRNLYLALYDEATDFVSFPIYRMNGERKNPTTGRPAGNGLTEFVIRTHAPLLIYDQMREALVERGVALIGTPSQCYLGVPILVNDRAIGVIAIQDYERANAYNADHAELLSTIASQAAIAIENARLYEAIQRELAERKRAEERLQQQNQFLLALQNTTLELVSQLDSKTLLENIVKRAGALIGTSAGLLDLVDPATNQLIPHVGVGALEASLHLPPAQPGEGLVGTVWQTGEILVIPDYDQWAGRLDKFSHGTLGSVIGLPLLSGAQVLGVLAIGSPSGTLYHFDPDAIEILKQFARLATVAVQNARLFASLQAELSERRQAEAALRASEVSYRGLFDTVGEAIYILDHDGRFADVNLGATKMYGYSRAELVGKTPEYVSAPGKNDLAGVAQQVQRAFEGEAQQFEFWGLRSNGEVFPKDVRLYLGHYFGQNVVIALARDITERKQAEEQVKKSLAEKETLLRELYHRTKNNMNVIIALLEMQAEAFNDERLKLAFLETENRIQSMALVHQKLYETSDLSHISLKEYIDNLMTLLMESYRISPERIWFDSKLEPVSVLIDTAVPCGLILNELISNALKYAFPAGQTGRIMVAVRRLENGEIHLTVADDGIGFPPGFDPRRDGNMGLQNIFLLGENQLKAQVSFNTTPGVTCQLQFKDNLYQPRV